MQLEFSRVDDEVGKNQFYHIDVIYFFFSPFNEEIEAQMFKDENILENQIDIKREGFLFLLGEINNEKYKDSLYKEEIKEKQKEIIPENEIINSIISDKETEKNNKPILGSLSSENNVLECCGTLGKHKKFGESTIQLSNGYLISIGSDSSILVFNDKFEKCEHNYEILKDFKDPIYTVLEIKNNKDKKDKEIHVIACCNKELYLFHFNFKDKSCKKEDYELPEMTTLSCVQMEENDFIVAGQKSTTLFKNLFFENQEEATHTDLVKNTTYRNAIKISDTIIALVSNSILVDGEDALTFYNIKNIDKKEKNGNKIRGYSFIASSNGLFLMSSKKNEQQNKILFCACKKYLPKQRNGILLVDVLDDKNQRIVKFNETENFQVYSFCPIFLDDDKNKNKKIETDYILVGGFDVDRREGRIKLFKALYDEEDKLNDVE